MPQRFTRCGARGVDCDVAIIGGGVVGLSCAAQLASARRSVALFERHGTFGQETSSRNSEVIHAGIYYAPGSLKAQLCVAGNAALYGWCARYGVPHRRTGKYVVATCADEEPGLDAIRARGLANGVSGLMLVPGSALRQIEPRVRATAALWSPATGIVDSHAFMASLVDAARERGCDFAWRHTVTAVDRTAAGWRLRVRDPQGETLEVSADAVVNAAGLTTDDVAALAGINVDAAGYRQTYVKGHYFRLRGAAPVKHLIYPVPPVGLPGLGIHVTLDLAGGARLGPDVEVLPSREQRYDVPEELRAKFFAAAARYLEGLSADDLSPDQAGIRPKLLRESPADFVIAEESARGLPGWVNLIGIESPGLTASLAIAGHVAQLLGL